MILDYETIKNIIPFERLANMCDGMEYLRQRIGYQYEYGISWEEFLVEHRDDCDKLLSEWLESVPDEEKLGWVRERQADLSRELDRINEFLFRYREGY